MPLQKRFRKGICFLILTSKLRGIAGDRRAVAGYRGETLRNPTLKPATT